MRSPRGWTLFPLPAAWKTLLGEFVVAPLATDGRRVYVATRDGVVRALDRATGEVLWKAEGLPGRLSAADGYVEYGKDGVPVVVVEDGSLMVQLAGADRKLTGGEKLALTEGSQPEPVRLAADTSDGKKAAATASGKAGKTTYGGVSAAGWTAIAGVVALAGGAVAIAVNDDSSLGDSNGSD